MLRNRRVSSENIGLPSSSLLDDERPSKNVKRAPFMRLLSKRVAIRLLLLCTIVILVYTLLRLNNKASNEDSLHVMRQVDMKHLIDAVNPTSFRRSDAELDAVENKLRTIEVKRIEPPDWHRCGRKNNAYVIFNDGSGTCVRNRQPHNELVFGEILAYRFARILGLTQVPVVVLARAGDKRFNNALVEKLREAGVEWEDGSPLGINEWIPGLGLHGVPLPAVMLQHYYKNTSLSFEEFTTLDDTTKFEILQWADMFIFDYITGNYDRFASMQDGAHEQQKESVVSEPTRNLRKNEQNMLWLVDNEPAFLDGYQQLYEDTESATRFLEFHKRSLGTICVFRKSTVQKLRQFSGSNVRESGEIGDAVENLMEKALAEEPLLTMNDIDSEKLRLHFWPRIIEVLNFIDKCPA